MNFRYFFKEKSCYSTGSIPLVKISPVQIELNSKNVQTELTSEKELISKPCEPILEVEKPSKPINPTLTKPL